MSPEVITADRIDDSFPRVSGDEPGQHVGLEQIGGFSPRERG